jgi:hypothetical protein
VDIEDSLAVLERTLERGEGLLAITNLSGRGRVRRTA